MGIMREEMMSGDAVLRIDVTGLEEQEHILEEMAFLNYRLASVQSRKEIRKSKPDMIWNREKKPKGIRYKNEQLFISGEWEQGELNKIIVTMLAFQMDKVGLHPFHSSAVRYRDKSILFLGGRIISTETTVADDQGVVVMGSKSVYLRTRSKGTERADLPSVDQGVAKFFDKEPEFINFEDPTPVDLVIMPGIDGHFDTKVVEMNRFEREYQTYHSVMNYFGLNQLVAPGGIIMPIVDTDELRRKRGDFVSRFAADKPYFMIRAKTPQLLFDEVEKLM
jgi:hypothetical protein